MNKRLKWFLTGTLAVMVGAWGCSGDVDDPETGTGGNSSTTSSGSAGAGGMSTGTSTGTGGEAPADVVTATVTVPAGFSATAQKLRVYYFATWPPAGEDGPDGSGLTIDNPDIADGKPLQISASHGGLSGSYHMIGVLYVAGGAGDDEPKVGVDFAGLASNNPIMLGGGEVAGGTIELALFTSP